MPTPTTSIRSTVKKAVVDLLTAGFNRIIDPSWVAPDPTPDGALPVSYGWPLTAIKSSGVYVFGPLPGEASVEYPLMMAGRKIRDDHFIIKVSIGAVAPGKTPYDSDVLAELYYGQLEDIFAADQTLSDLPGIISMLLGPQVSGPDGEPIPTGARSIVVADLKVHARLS